MLKGLLCLLRFRESVTSNFHYSADYFYTFINWTKRVRLLTSHKL